MKRKLCLTYLLKLFENIMSRLDQAVPADVMYLNSQKPFNQMSHNKLLHETLHMAFCMKYLPGQRFDKLAANKQPGKGKGKNTSGFLH